MRTNWIFRSRWLALLWAAGIIWFAVTVAGSQPQDANETANAEQASDTAAALNSF